MQHNVMTRLEAPELPETYDVGVFDKKQVMERRASDSRPT